MSATPKRRKVYWQDDPEYLKRREEDIRQVVAEAPPLTADQIVMLRRIFANPSGKQSRRA